MARRPDQHTVVVGVDGSAEGTEALRYAVGAAQARGMWLFVVHAYDLPPHGPMEAAALAAAAAASAYRVTADALSQVTVPAELEVETAVELTTPLRLLERLSADAALIVLGQHTIDPAASSSAQPLSSAVAAGSSCPLIIVPPGWSRRRALSRSIVVGLDDQTSVRVVLGFAFREADRRGWSVVALQALSGAAVPAQQSARSADIDAVIAEQRQEHPTVPVTVAVTLNSLAQIVLDDSRRARLVVVGRPHGLTAQAGAWSTATVEPALADAYCPLALVPDDAWLDDAESAPGRPEPR